MTFPEKLRCFQVRSLSILLSIRFFHMTFPFWMWIIMALLSFVGLISRNPFSVIHLHELISSVSLDFSMPPHSLYSLCVQEISEIFSCFFLILNASIIFVSIFFKVSLLLIRTIYGILSILVQSNISVAPSFLFISEENIHCYIRGLILILHNSSTHFSLFYQI